MVNKKVIYNLKKRIDKLTETHKAIEVAIHNTNAFSHVSTEKLAEVYRQVIAETMNARILLHKLQEATNG